MGCATGNFSIEFALNNFFVTGLDFSSQMIKIATQKALKLNITNIEFILFDILDINKLDKNCYNVLFASHIFHLIENNDILFKEYAKKICSNGIFVFVIKTKRIPKTNLHKTKFINILTNLLRKILFSKYKNIPPNIQNLTKNLLELGFTNILETDTTNNKVLIFRKCN